MSKFFKVTIEEHSNIKKNVDIREDINTPIRNKVERIVLMYPNQKWLKTDITTTWDLPPYTLCLLAAMISDHYEVKIIDAQMNDLSEEEFKQEIIDFKPDCVGISLLTSEYAPILDSAVEIIKQIDETILTIAGGVHVTTQYYKAIKNTNIDICIRGEGEYVFRQLLDAINGIQEWPTKGLVYIDKKGKTVSYPADIIKDLDNLPEPDYHLIDIMKYFNHIPRQGVDVPTKRPYARIFTSRGCSVGCSFCQVEYIAGTGWRRRTPEKIIDELEMLKEKYGIRSFYIEDDNAFISRKRTKKMLRLMIDRKLDLQWKAAGVPIFKMDDETFQLMSESGCQMIGMAIESGTHRILNEVIHKPVDLDSVPEMIARAINYGLYVVCNFIIGFPSETWNEIRQTLEYAENCGADYCKIYAAQPLVGTELFEITKKMGCLVGDEEDVDWRYGRIKSEHFTTQDISILRAYEWDRINFTCAKKREKTAKIMGISLEELDVIRKKTRDALIF